MTTEDTPSLSRRSCDNIILDDSIQVSSKAWRSSIAPRSLKCLQRLTPGIQSHVVQEDSNAEYQLQAIRRGGYATGMLQPSKHSEPRSMPDLGRLDFFRDKALALNTSMRVNTVAPPMDLMMSSSTETSRPPTPGSSQSSQPPSTLIRVRDTRQSVDVKTESKSEGRSPIVTMGSETHVAPSFLERRDEAESPINYKPSDGSDSCEDDDYDKTEDDQECPDCRAAGNVDKFEAHVRRIAGKDLALAAYLIPLLHIMAHQEHTATNKRKSVPTTQSASGSGEKAAGGFAPGSDLFSGGGGQKRSAYNTTSDQEGGKQQEDKDEDEDEQRGNERDTKKLKSSDDKVVDRLACPFNKWRPEKYNIHYDTSHSGKAEFQVCHGPGLTDINRLKAHLKEVHTFVQCERCSKVFKGQKQKRIKDLQKHRRQNCQSNPPLMSEGITDETWDEIENIPKPRKGRPETAVEKWWKIWDILFPAPIQRPDNPWCTESHVAGVGPSTFDEAVLEFSQCYNITLGEKDDYTAYAGNTNVESLCRDTFQLYYARNMMSSSATSLPLALNSNHMPSTAPSLGEGSNKNISCIVADENNLGCTFPHLKSEKLPSSRRVASSPQIQSVEKGSSTTQLNVGRNEQHSRNRPVSFRSSLQNADCSADYTPSTFSNTIATPKNPSYPPPYQSSQTYNQSPGPYSYNSMQSPSHYGHGLQGFSNVSQMGMIAETQAHQAPYLGDMYLGGEGYPYDLSVLQPQSLAVERSEYQQYSITLPIDNSVPQNGAAFHTNVGHQSDYTKQQTHNLHGYSDNDNERAPNEDSGNAAYQL